MPWLAAMPYVFEVYIVLLFPSVFLFVTEPGIYKLTNFRSRFTVGSVVFHSRHISVMSAVCLSGCLLYAVATYLVKLTTTADQLRDRLISRCWTEGAENTHPSRLTDC